MNLVIYAAETLDKFTNRILIEGFNKLKINAKRGNFEFELEPNSDAVIYQLHGAPQAESDDILIMNLIKQALSDKSDIRKKVIMIHRPDEIKKFTEVKGFFSESVNKFGFVNYGDNHINDDFFSSENMIKKVIPHGFSSKIRNIPKKDKPIIIGSHTSWGEMRSLEHAFTLIGEVFNRYRGEKTILGYVGGKPVELLKIPSLEKKYKKIFDDYQIKLKDANQFDIDNSTNEKNVILINQENSELSYYNPSFNLQMYYLGDRIRTGESSGTIYRSISIPVIFEMNGSIDDLRTIKVPYTDVNNIKSIDLPSGAKKIVEVIQDDSYVEMLNHNLQQAKAWNEKHIAKEYLELLNEL